LLKSSGMGFFL